jgi:hypothetical protein
MITPQWDMALPRCLTPHCLHVTHAVRTEPRGKLADKTYPDEHPAPPVIVDTGQPIPMLTTGGQPLIRMVTIDNAMLFHVLISSDEEISLMSL